MTENNKTPQTDESVKHNILEAIKTGQTTMRPRWYFVLRTITFIGLMILAALAAVFFTSFVFFTLRQSGLWFAPGLGLRGVGILFTALPWLMVAVALILAAVAAVIIKRRSLYRQPAVFTVVVVGLLIVVGALGIAHTSLHRGLFEQARNNHLPLAGKLYRVYGLEAEPHENVVAGMVLEKLPDGYRVQDLRRHQAVQVLVVPETRFPFGEDIDLDDNVIVIGQWEAESLRAFAVREVDGDDFPRGGPFMDKPMMHQ